MRRVIFAKRIAIGDDVVSARELGQAAFALVIEYVPPKRGHYRIKARIKPRDDEIGHLIAKHKLAELELFVDRAATAADRALEDLRTERDEGLRDKGLEYIWSHGLWWVLARQGAAWVRQQRTVRVSFGRLLEGIEVDGTMEELRHLARELTMQVDRLSAQIEAGASFDRGEIRVFAPGSRGKVEPEASRTPPSRWRK